MPVRPGGGAVTGAAGSSTFCWGAPCDGEACGAAMARVVDFGAAVFDAASAWAGASGAAGCDAEDCDGAAAAAACGAGAAAWAACIAAITAACCAVTTPCCIQA